MEERENDEINDDFGEEAVNDDFPSRDDETDEESEFRREVMNQKHLTDSLSGLI